RSSRSPCRSGRPGVRCRRRAVRRSPRRGTARRRSAAARRPGPGRSRTSREASPPHSPSHSCAAFLPLRPRPFPKARNWWEYASTMEDSEQSAHDVDEERFRRLIDIGSNPISELDLEAVLRSVAEAARELTGARYAALGVLDPERRELERFINVGIDEET